MIILFASEKGGTGKSTLSTNISTVAAQQGKTVLLVDADMQGTSALWALDRDRSNISPKIPFTKEHGKSIHQKIKKIHRDYDMIFIDTGGRDSPEMRASMLIADKFYMPIRASQFDAWSLDKADELIHKALKHNNKLQSYAVINQAPTNPAVSEIEECREYLQDFDHIKPCRTVIHDRIAFRKAAREGLSVTELKPKDNKATAEIMSLYKEITHG
jgi:chromosome partitioning protein